MKYKSLIAASFAALLLYVTVFAQSTFTGTVNKAANLRAGPGTTYALAGTVKQGQTVTIVGKNTAGNWYHLDGGQWIAAFLVNVATTAAPQAGQQPTTSAPQIVLQAIVFDGQVRQVESDEYAVVANTGATAVNVKGWKLNAGDPGQDFYFPSFELKPGQNCRIYTNELHADTCGFSFGSTKALWNNKGDCGYLYDAAGHLVSSTCYGNATPVAPQTKAVIVPTTAAPVQAPTAAPTATPLPPPTATAQPAPTANPNSGQRYGAICQDGTQSNATGRGACSHHGGVNHWLIYP
ncbi:MAG: lamin tail domain-containing protein [Caldilineaceae bacterium]